MKAQSVYNTILRHQQQYYTTPNHENYQDFLINPFAFNELTVKGIIDLSEMEFVQVSDNIAAMLGTTADKKRPFQIQDFYSTISTAHLNLFPQIVRWVFDNWTAQPELQHISGCMCGLRLKDDKLDKRLMMQFYPHQMQPNGIPTSAIFSMMDVTHLVKGDVFWFRIVVHKRQATEVHTFTFPPKCLGVGEMLSKREQEILIHLANGHESKMIAKQLNISVFTVNNHRKNMIARIGARDTTALIQLCQMAGIYQRI